MSMKPNQSNRQVLLSRVLAERKAHLSPDSSDSDFFELLAASELLKHSDLGTDELLDGIMGGGNDGGIDGLYVLVGGDPLTPEHVSTTTSDLIVEIVVFQSKTSASFSGTALDKLISTFTSIFDLGREVGELRKLYNERLLERVSLLRDFYTANFSRISHLRVRTYYVTRGEEVNPSMHAQVTSLQDVAQRLFPGCAFEFHFVGAGELLEMLRTPRAEWLELALAESPLVAGGTGYVSLVRLAEFAKFLTAEDGLRKRRLFLDNVRDFEGENPVNRAIRDTLANPDSQDFWTLNNGVTILAEEVRQGYRTLGLREPKIVNGLQTSLVVFEHSRTANLDQDQRSLLVRVVVPVNEVARDRIIVATNSQTAISRGVLKATDAIHKDLEDYFRGSGFFYERRRNAHRNDGVPLDRIITMPHLARAVTSVVLCQPYVAAKVNSAGRILTNEAQYGKVFSPDYPLSVFLNSILLVKRVESFIGRASSDEDFEHHHGGRQRPTLWWTQWHVAMLLAIEASGDTKVGPSSIAAINQDVISDKAIETTVNFANGYFRRARTAHRRTVYQLTKSQALTELMIDEFITR